MYDTKRIQEELEPILKQKDTKHFLLQTNGIETTSFYEPDNPEDYQILMHDTPYINSIIEELELCFTRAMVMKPATVYSWHRDNTKRVHVPVTLTEGSAMVLEDTVIRFEPGVPMLIDTTKYHTAFNPSRTESRVHIVGVPLNEDSNLLSWQ